MAGMSPAVARSGYRLTVLLTVAVVLAQFHPRHRPATVCLLRGLTGIPCPFCGGTTAAVHAGRLDLPGALRASPLAVLGAPLVAVWPALGSRVARAPSYARLGGLAAVLIGSELWQLHRFGWV
ncbi:MAG: hypothetical protein QOI82_283 [Actinomycetota bacterium]|jgi:hypothetical protein|nr:hypothetical protein [Actinomycetota bacterium]